MPPVLHLKLFHPANDHYGMSPIEAASTAIDIHNTAAEWNKALLDNSARPSGALVYTGGEGRMTAEQFARLREELEAGFQGARQAGRPLLLEGGLDWKALGLTPKDMDFIEAKNAAAREIALALGVPPMLLGIPGDNTYSNYQEAQRAFWRSTVLPLFNRTMKALSAWLAPAWDANLALRGDLDQIDALTIEREALWARLQRVSFLTDDEKRAAIGYGPMPAAAMEAPAPIPFDDAAAGDEGKFNPNWAAQPRVPKQTEGAGQWADGGPSGGLVHQAQNRSGRVGGRGKAPATPEEERRLRNETDEQVRAGLAKEVQFNELAATATPLRKELQKADPKWKGPTSILDPNDIDGRIKHQKMWNEAAAARLREISTIPGVNPKWGVRRVVKELYAKGYRMDRRADNDDGTIYRNPRTTEEVRVMERPKTPPNRTESSEKYANDYYYRYRRGDGFREGRHVTIPNK